MILRPPRSTRTDTLFPYTTLFRSRVNCVLLDGATGDFGWHSASRPHDTKVSIGARQKWVLHVHVHVIPRSEEHTSELQSLMRISYAVFCLKKKIPHNKL